MSATEHTPGNWHMSDKDAIIEVWAGDTPIAVMEGPTDEAERANAARMAAAPDLLEALERALPSLCKCGSRDCCETTVRQQAVAAIAKAKGE